MIETPGECGGCCTTLVPFNPLQTEFAVEASIGLYERLDEIQVLDVATPLCPAILTPGWPPFGCTLEGILAIRPDLDFLHILVGSEVVVGNFKPAEEGSEFCALVCLRLMWRNLTGISVDDAVSDIRQQNRTPGSGSIAFSVI